MAMTVEEREKADALIESIIQRNKLEIPKEEKIGGADETKAFGTTMFTWAIITSWLWIPILYVLVTGESPLELLGFEVE